MKPPFASQQLLEALRGGEEWAYMKLFDEFFSPLHSYALRLLNDADVANDVVQEVFCHLFEARHSLQPDFNLTAYLFRAVYNGCISELRHSEVVKSYVTATQQDFFFNEVLQHPEAEIELQQIDIQQAVNDALLHLPPRCQEVFVMSKLKDMSNREISEKLNISIKTVEAQMTKALSTMRQMLGWLAETSTTSRK